MWPLTAEGGENRVVGEWRGAQVPSRTRNPMFDQSIVLSGGGGKTILNVCSLYQSYRLSEGTNKLCEILCG